MPGKGLLVVLFAALCLSCSRGERAHTASAEQATTAADGRDASSTPASAAEQEEAASIPAQDAAAASAPLPASPAQPIPVPDPPEAVMADYLREPGNPMMPGRQVHAVFAAEKRDDTWADYVEAKLRDYFGRQRGVGNIAIVSLACRSTMCEVLAVVRAPNGAPADEVRWQEIVFALKRERWYASSEIREPSMEFGTTGDGRHAILTYLLRK